MAKNKPLRFSYSKMSTYSECPLKYKYKYVDKIPGVARYYFSFGAAIHAALEYMHSEVKMPSEKKVVAYFTERWDAKHWQDAGYPDAAKYIYASVNGASMLSAYYQKYCKTKAFLTEYCTDVEVDGLKVRIIADKLEYLGRGVVRIIDYKTGKNVTRTPEQLMMYQKIVECDPKLLALVRELDGKVKKVKVAETIYLHVPSLEEHPFARYATSEIKVFWDTVLKVAKNILAERFNPTPSDRACKWCDYRTRCPMHKTEGADL